MARGRNSSARPAARRVILSLDQSFGQLRITDRGGLPELVGVAPTQPTLELLRVAGHQGLTVELLPLTPLPVGARERIEVLLPELARVLPARDGWLSAVASRGEDLAGALLVSADRQLRALAADRCAVALPHPSVALLWLDDQRPRPLLVRGTRGAFERLPCFVPYRRAASPEGGAIAIGVGTARTMAWAADQDLDLCELPLDLARQDLLLVDVGAVNEELRREIETQHVLRSEGGQLLVAIDAFARISSLRLDGGHGAFTLLSPQPDLLSPPCASASFVASVHETIATWPDGLEPRDEIPAAAFTPVMEVWPTVRVPRPTPAAFEADVARYSGQVPLDAEGSVSSRHVDHPDNARAVAALVRDLRALGYCTHLHAFVHEGRTLYNVIADLPGRGVWTLRLPELRRRIRDLLLEPELDRAALEPLLGAGWMNAHGVHQLDERALRDLLQQLALLPGWWPWWRDPGHGLPGADAELVMVACHLDSTARRQQPYDPTRDPAPGADDDASGMAAVLGVARYLRHFRDDIVHNVRLCFFNAEEVGIAGSQAFAAQLKADDAPVRAVICADQIGWNVEGHPVFEVHAGHSDADLRDVCQPLAERLCAWGASLPDLEAGRVFCGTRGGAGMDRRLTDPAIGRSDHASFQDHGFPAVVVSEELFAAGPGRSGWDGNPKLHTPDDVAVDADYGADIAYTIARTVRELAGA